jgi:DNA-binding PadR family transcriptional regulator
MHGHGPMDQMGGWHGRHGRRGFGGGHGRDRARRGDVQAAILGLLAEKDMHGYQIIQELSERSGGAWTPSPGSISPTLQAMEDQDLVTSEQVGGKRVFSLTEQGRALSAEQPAQAPWEDLAQAAGSKQQLREAMFGLGAATMQVARSGSEEQAEQVAAILDEARKRIYMMLAE